MKVPVPVFAAEAHWRRSASGLANLFRSLVSPKMAPALYYLDFIIFPLLILGFLISAFGMGSVRTSLVSAAVALTGFAFWTLAEYGVHRFVLHHMPVFAPLHLAHHQSPRALIGTPTVFSVAMFLVAGFLPALMLTSMTVASAWMVGLLSGYLLYLVVHYAVHHTSSGRYELVRRLKRHHSRHHHRDGHSNFGVTTTLWDRVFGTLGG